MNDYPLAIYCDHPEVHFEVQTAARLARVSIAFIRECEREDLVCCRTMLHGKKGLCVAEVRKLKLVRHLHEDLGLDLEAVDMVLRYRNRIQALQNRLEKAEAGWQRRRQQYRAEIGALKAKLAKAADER